MDVTKWASFPALWMGPAPRDVCPAVGSDHFFLGNGVPEIMHMPQDYFAPGALDSANREVARFLHSKRATQIMGGHLVRFDPLRRKDEARADGWIFPGDVRLELLRSGRIPVPRYQVSVSGNCAGRFSDCFGGKADETSIRPNERHGAAGRAGGDGFVGIRQDSFGGRRLRSSGRPL